MTDRASKISELDELAAVSSNDVFVVVHGANTNKAKKDTVLLTINSNTVTTNTVFVTGNSTPSTSTDTVSKGKIWYDDNYLYIAIGEDTIKRIALEAF